MSENNVEVCLTTQVCYGRKKFQLPENAENGTNAEKEKINAECCQKCLIISSENVSVFPERIISNI